MLLDLSLAKYREYWMRHPVLGDPSFDSFRRVGKPVHVSTPPYDWAVNGSLFRDFDGCWYCYTGLYLRGYACDQADFPSAFKIYRSRDQGESWEDLGLGFERGFRFSHRPGVWDSCPDVVLCYDERSGKYLLTYDTGSSDATWENAHDLRRSQADSGAALAWADTPAGPFRRMNSLLFSNTDCFGKLGRWKRLYASTVLPRANDYIAFALNDSSVHYAWALAVLTAPAPEGPWSEPTEVLCCDRPDFYPCPCEFYPVFCVDGVCYAHATSVALNRNYQFVFSAPLERAHDPSAWQMCADGSIWHARDLPEEYDGIWGQTLHGFVEPDTRRFVAMFPSKNAEDRGTVNIAARPWDQPYTDGFTMTAHGGPSVSLLRCACGDFSLEASFAARGTVDFALEYEGVLGPNDSVADSVPAPGSLRGYSALRVEASSCSLVTVDADGNTTVHACLPLSAPAASVRLIRENGVVWAEADGQRVGEMPVSVALPRPLGLILAPRSRIDCTRFSLETEPARWTQRWNVMEGVLGAGQRHPAKEIVPPDAPLSPDVWHRTEGGVIGQGRIALKWNLICDGFTIHTLPGEKLGTLGVWVDGRFVGSRALSPEAPSFSVSGLVYGRHGIRAEPVEGVVAVAGITVAGAAELCENAPSMQ